MKLILGTMNFGPQVDLEEGCMMISSFLKAGYSEIDSAYVYNEGTTEKMLGNIMQNFDRSSFSIATKVNPRVSGKLDRHAVLTQCNESLERMNLNSVDILYLHMPDPKTPIEETLEACAELHKNNKIKEVGLSNYPAWLVAHIWHECDKYGWPKPTVYQGLYNAISRKAEKELFLCLRHFGIRFYAFNPLAGGLLTGKHLDYDKEPEPGRFSRLESYRNRYWKKSFFDAVNLITKACQEAGIKPAQAAYRWLTAHSCLDQKMGDAIIVGASSMAQFNANMQALGQPTLPTKVLEAFDKAWQEALNESPEYYYFYK